MNEAVRLKLARRGFWSGGGFSGTYAVVTAKIKNVAFAKSVAVLYTPDDHTWKEFPLAFAAHYGDYDTFDGSVNEQVHRLAVRYSAGGETFFDNNGGWDYAVGSALAAVGGNVVLSTATARRGTQAGGGFTFTTSWVEGEILVTNLSYAKDVGVRLSVDGGTTWADAHGTFAGQNTGDGVFVGPGAEVWRFKTPELNLVDPPADFRFAVFYRNVATGQVYWDNNFGQDYKLSKAAGATIG